MRNRNTVLKIISCVILASILAAGCSSAPQAASEAEDILEQSFFSNLSALQNTYGFSSIEEIDLTTLEDITLSDDGVVWQAADGDMQPLQDLLLNDQEGLLLEFSYSQQMEDAGSTLYFVLQPADGSADSPQIYLSKDGLVVLKDGQPQGSYLFQDGFDWQTGTRYAMFLNRTQAGGLQVIVWNMQDPAQTSRFLAEEDILGNSLVQVNLKLDGEQSLAIHNLWKLVYTPTVEAADQAAMQVAAAVLDGYQVQETTAIEALECEGHTAGEHGVFSWDAMTNEHCDLNLQMGQALTFDFVLANPANGQSRVAIIMLDANLKGSDMPVKNLGITLANDKAFVKMDYEELTSIEYGSGFELDAGITYSAAIVMNGHNQFDIQIWPANDPDLSMSIILDDSNVPSGWLPVEGEDWDFGMWIPEDQQVTISNLYRYSLEETAQAEDLTSPDEENTVEDNESVSQAPDWIATGIIPNLGDFYITNITPYETIECKGMDEMLYDTGVLEFPLIAEDLTHECQLDLPQGSGLIFEFIYSGENAAQQDAHLLDFAISNGEGEAQKIIRFMPVSNDLILKSSDQFVDSYTMQGQINWEPGRRYTMVFIPSYNKYIYVWPTDDPQQSLAANIASEEWEGYFGADDPHGTWQLRTWVAAGIELQMWNFYRFEAN